MLEIAYDENGNEILLKHTFSFENDEISDIYDVIDHMEEINEEILDAYMVS